jgi:predicted amidophosphoribosyltransferase
MTQSFKCYQHGHVAIIFKRPQICVNCAKNHPSTAGPTAKDPHTYLCSNCKGKQQTWDRACPAHMAEAEQAAAAYATQLKLYKIHSNSTQAVQSQSIHLQLRLA